MVLFACLTVRGVSRQVALPLHIRRIHVMNAPPLAIGALNKLVRPFLQDKINKRVSNGRRAWRPRPPRVGWGPCGSRGPSRCALLGNLQLH